MRTVARVAGAIPLQSPGFCDSRRLARRRRTALNVNNVDANELERRIAYRRARVSRMEKRTVRDTFFTVFDRNARRPFARARSRSRVRDPHIWNCRSYWNRSIGFRCRKDSNSSDGSRRRLAGEDKRAQGRCLAVEKLNVLV